MKKTEEQGSKLQWEATPAPLNSLAGSSCFKPTAPLTRLNFPSQRATLACVGAQGNQMASFVQGVQRAVEEAVGNFQKGVKLPAWSWPPAARSPKVAKLETAGGAQAVAEAVPEGPPRYDPEKTARQMQAWRERSTWTDEPAKVKVVVPKGAFCELSSSFKVGLPPDALFDILTDPGNNRVFKNIKEVTFRKVLEDDGNLQQVELEQAAIWRFLCWSGTFAVRLFVTQNRRERSLAFRLADGGFMKSFEGTWNIRPITIDEPPGSSSDEEIGRVASLATLRQSIQPSMVPPPPIDWYLRGITTRSMHELIHDIQVEAKRLREDGAISGGLHAAEAASPMRQELWAVSRTHTASNTGGGKVLLRRDGRAPRAARPKRKTDGTWRDKDHTPRTPRRLPSTPRC